MTTGAMAPELKPTLPNRPQMFSIVKRNLLCGRPPNLSREDDEIMSRIAGVRKRVTSGQCPTLAKRWQNRLLDATTHAQEELRRCDLDK